MWLALYRLRAPVVVPDVGERGGGWGGDALPILPPGRLYRTAKEKLPAGRQEFSFTQSTMDPAGYCEKAKHYDFTWFEMQHKYVGIQRYRGHGCGLSACGGESDDSSALGSESFKAANRRMVIFRKAVGALRSTLTRRQGKWKHNAARFILLPHLPTRHKAWLVSIGRHLGSVMFFDTSLWHLSCDRETFWRS
jgi:hypothetical protein